MSKQNRLTGTSVTASAMPCLRRRYMTSWNGRRSPVAGSAATTSPSRIASRGPSPAASSSTTSGNWVETRSSRRVNSSSSPSAVRWACTRMPSYLYSAAQVPPSLSRTSAGLDSRQPAGGQRRGDQAQVRADVVGALQHRAGGAAACVDGGQRVQDGGGADPQPQRAGDRADQVAALQRGGLPEQPGEQVEFAALGALTLLAGDLVEGLEHHRDLQGRRPPGGRGGQ